MSDGRVTLGWRVVGLTTCASVLWLLAICGGVGTGRRSGRWLRLGVLALLALFPSWMSAAVAAAGVGGKVVRYHGARLFVPRSWPVYHLGSDPGVCVRFDRNAVYLGQPSPVERCPAHAVGRTEAILVEPLAAHGVRARAATGSALWSVTSRDAQPRQGSSARMVVASSGVIVTATWANHPEVVERALGARLATTGRADGAAAPAAPTAAAPARTARAAAGGVYTGLGFDACSAPNTARMSAWDGSPYRAVGIFIGGTNMACAQPNLTAGWVKKESAAGWHLIPTYVGLQAPSNSCGCSSIAPSRASAEGAAAASDAVSQAGAVGLGRGNPIYFDMEGYKRGRADTSAVLAFLAAWTSRLHAQGYKSGVYSNATLGIRDLVAAQGSGYREPDDIWIAEWNGERSASSPYVPSSDWSNHRRLHQYAGDHSETYRGVTLSIDSNYVDGETATAPSAGAADPAMPDRKVRALAGRRRDARAFSRSWR